MAKAKEAAYAYTIRDDVDRTLPDQSGDSFDEKAVYTNRAGMVISPYPDRKSMRYVGTDYLKEPDLDVTKAGAGRGKQGGPTAKELKDYEKSRTTDYAKGGKVSSASSRADGIAQRGKTRGVMVACGGGYMKGKK